MVARQVDGSFDEAADGEFPAMPPLDRAREPTDDEVAALLDDVFAASEDWAAAPSRLIAGAEGAGYDVDGPAITAARHTTRVVLRLKTEPGRRAEVVLEPLCVPLDGSDPTRPRDAAPAAADLWRHVAETASHPATRARVLDVLVTRGGPSKPQDAADAAGAYLDLARLGRHSIGAAPRDDVTDDRDVGGGHETTRMWTLRSVELAVGRALALAPIAASSPMGPALKTDAVALALDLAEAALSRPQALGGGGLTMLRLVAAVRDLAPADAARLAFLAERLADARPDQDHFVDGAAEIVVVLDASRRDEMNRRRVNARLLAAQDKPAAARLLILEQAAGLAVRLGQRELAEQATRAMQAVDKGDLGLATISSKARIHAEIIDIEVENMSAGANWREALDSWLAAGSPTGDPERNERAVRRSPSRGGLRRFLPTVLLGADGLPRWHARGEQDEDDAELARVEQHHIGVYAWIIADALDRVPGSGRPATDDLALHLSDGGKGDVVLAAALARSLQRYWDGDWEGSLHTSVPRVEAAARRLVLQLDLAAYKVARSNDPGKYVGLGVLIGLLADAGLDRSWERFLRVFLTGPLGMNVRNDVAHGFVLADPGRHRAAVSLRALGLLVRLLTEPVEPLRAPAPPLPPDDRDTVVAAVAAAALAAARRPQDIPGLFADEVRTVARLARRARQRGCIANWRQLGRPSS